MTELEKCPVCNNIGYTKKIENELNDRIKDHEITYRELYDVMGVYDPCMEYIDEYGKLDKIAIHNPELNNGAYI